MAAQPRRGRLIDHIGLVVRDLAASKAFYSAVFDALAIPMGGADEHNFWADELYVSSRDSGEIQGELTGRHHIAFQASDRAMVDAFHTAALAHGGRDNGAPGERAYHPGYYAAFVLDPDGNNIEAVFHGGAEQAAEDFFRQLEAHRTKALVARDLATLEQLHAPEYQLVTPAGKVMTREAYLGAVRREPFYSAWDVVGDVQVRRTGQMAAVRYRARLVFPSGRVVVCWHTDTYELRSAGWQAVWSQATEMPPATQ